MSLGPQDPSGRVGLTQPSRREIRQQCRSTGKTRLPKEYIMTQRAVFLPTPCSERRSCSQSWSGRCFKGARVGLPNSSSSCASKFLILRAFCCDSPPAAIICAIFCTSAEAREAYVGNALRNCVNVLRWTNASMWHQLLATRERTAANLGPGCRRSHADAHQMSWIRDRGSRSRQHSTGAIPRRLCMPSCSATHIRATSPA